MIWVRCNYACPLTAGPESVHAKDGADHVPLIFLSSVFNNQPVKASVYFIVPLTRK